MFIDSDISVIVYLFENGLFWTKPRKAMKEGKEEEF